MSKLDSDNKAVTSIELKLRLKKTRISLPSVFPVRLLAGIHCLELKDKSWIPERVRDDIYTHLVFPACLLAGIHFLEPKDKSWIPEQVRVDNCSMHDRHFRPPWRSKTIRGGG
ncbi:hypothetical protein [Shewanella sp.]|uniref:hypothetical protein n=1 Tax=Shewanella sp. TaxID=50422 RepID=UPI00258AAF02|nr:hypothetical protein [Shewanella sp.]MCJ8305307.1 hypothetical protein [Shewanella sp.]